MLWVPNFIALGICFSFWSKFSWNESIEICFNVKYMLLARDFDFLGGYVVVTARFLVATAGYCLFPGDYCSLSLITAHYRSLLFPLLIWTVLRNFTKFTGKHLCQSLFFNSDFRPATSLKKRLLQRCFPVNFVKYLRTPFFTEHLRWLLLKRVFTHTITRLIIMKMKMKMENRYMENGKHIWDISL